MTLFDLRQTGGDVALTMSHVAARQEVRALLTAIALPEEDDLEAETQPAAEAAPVALA